MYGEVYSTNIKHRIFCKQFLNLQKSENIELKSLTRTGLTKLGTALAPTLTTAGDGVSKEHANLHIDTIST